jgi:hypothetical protein
VLLLAFSFLSQLHPLPPHLHFQKKKNVRYASHHRPEQSLARISLVTPKAADALLKLPYSQLKDFFLPRNSQLGLYVISSCYILRCEIREDLKRINEKQDNSIKSRLQDECDFYTIGSLGEEIIAIDVSSIAACQIGNADSRFGTPYLEFEVGILH